MAMLFQRIKWFLLIGISIPIVFFLYLEFLPESTFNLANDSRLPKWVTLTPGSSRADVSLTMSYYIGFAQFILRDKNEHILKQKFGRTRCTVPFKPETPPQGFPPGYPAYEAITVNGITEIIEHKKMEAIFYLTYDPAVWKQYHSIGCG